MRSGFLPLGTCSATVSIRQFIEEYFVTNLNQLLQTHKLPGKHLILVVIAEKIENRQQDTLLQETGCMPGQGCIVPVRATVV